MTAPNGLPLPAPSIYGDEIRRLRELERELRHKLEVEKALLNMVTWGVEGKREQWFTERENLQCELRHWQLRAESAERQLDELRGGTVFPPTASDAPLPFEELADMYWHEGGE